MTTSARAEVRPQRRPLPELNQTQWSVDVVPTRTKAEWTSDLLRAVEELGRLESGWDGGRSPPISASVLETARRVLLGAASNNSAPAPHVAAVPGGGIQFEWHLSSRILELEILPSCDLSYLCVDGETEEEGTFKAEKSRHAEGLVKWLIS